MWRDNQACSCHGQSGLVRLLTFFTEHKTFHSACFVLLATQVRHLLKQGKSVEGMVGKAVARYIRDNTIAERVSGRQKWTVEVRLDAVRCMHLQTCVEERSFCYHTRIYEVYCELFNRQNSLEPYNCEMKEVC